MDFGSLPRSSRLDRTQQRYRCHRRPDRRAWALPQKAREHVLDWYFNTLLSRLDDKQNGAIVLVMQRLHEDDLVGVLLRESDESTALNCRQSPNRTNEFPLGMATFRTGAPATCSPEREPMAIL